VISANWHAQENIELIRHRKFTSPGCDGGRRLGAHHKYAEGLAETAVGYCGCEFVDVVGIGD